VVPPCSDRISRVPPYSSLQLCITCTGLSPTAARLSRRFHLSQLKHWPSPRSLATTSGVSVDVLSSRYLDVSVPWVCFYTPMYSGIDTFSMITGNPKPHPCRRRCLVSTCDETDMTSKFRLSKVGCPIRRSAGRRLFAPHHSLSQRTTSFIASYRQGIHQMPLGHLIALISNAHHFTQGPERRWRASGSPSYSARRALLRKTRSRDEPRRSAVAASCPEGWSSLSSPTRRISSLRCP
jgi:hypothetical protein